MHEVLPPTAPPIDLPRALVLLCRVTDCQCGAVYSAPEIYGRYARDPNNPGRQLRRLAAMPPFRLPIERKLIRISVPFCCICISGHDPMHGLPPPPKEENLWARPPVESPPPVLIARASSTKRKSTVVKLTIDDIYSSL